MCTICIYSLNGMMAMPASILFYAYVCMDDYYFDVIRMSTIEDILQQERNKSTIDIQALSTLLYSPEEVGKFKQICSRTAFPYDFNIFNKSRVDLIKDSMKMAVPSLLDRDGSDWDTLGYVMRTHVQLPYTIHVTMFVRCLEIMGTESQQEEWFKRAMRGEIIGCYAQTELGHGSDVQNLQTTATYNMDNDTFILNTPSISAAKFWPGDLGIFATHALVFAQMIVQGQRHGVHAFIVPIREVSTLKPLPGIQVGDIGPKIGFETKDNGYLVMKNIVIPKSNMLRRFVSVSKQGQIKTKGDPKVSYATMMIIRQTISCFYPKVYSEAIIIATRYSLFRKQFLNALKKQIPVIDYQSQKEKIIPRVAQYFAVTIGGNAIKRLTDENLRLVKEKNDFSLMAESHVCLCVGKALFSEIVYDGMETLRKACGGHGFSHYSGIPNLLNEYVSNLTLEGENTILYLQIARYLLKNYKYAMTQKKPVGVSVDYLLQFGDIISSRVENDRIDWEKWTLADLQLLLKQSVCHSLGLITEKMMKKPEGMSELDLWNKVAGVQVKRVAVSHGFLYTFSKFKEVVQGDKNTTNKEVLYGLCRLFGAHTALSNAVAITEGGYIMPAHITGLIRLKEKLLEEIRPNLVAILDSFLIPQGYLRSAFAKGNPYDNFLELARNCELNKQVIEAAFTVRNNIQRVIKMHQSKL